MSKKSLSQMLGAPFSKEWPKNKREDKGFKNKSYYSANIGTACGLSYF